MAKKVSSMDPFTAEWLARCKQNPDLNSEILDLLAECLATGTLDEKRLVTNLTNLAETLEVPDEPDAN